MRAASSMWQTLAALCIVCWSASVAAQEAYAWAYPVNPPDFKLPPDDGAPRRVPDSSVAYSTSQVRDRFVAPDWHPADHPTMPPVVAAGRRPDVSACGFCHRAEGTGAPENASLAGLSADYIVQQMLDYKSGARSTSVPNRAPHTLMIAGAKAISDDDVRAAALYFSGLKPRRNIRVVEAEDVPATFVAGWFLARQDDGRREPIGRRIIETPDQLEHFESRDSRATFTAFVPLLSLDQGKALVEGKRLRIPACSTCHGPELRGLGSIPSIAGRSPTYMFRQLREFRSGVRAGIYATLMKETVAAMSDDDMVAIAAYLASIEP